MDKRHFVLVHETARDRACAAIRSAPNGMVVTVAEPSRNLEQNAAQWPILQAFADQLKWPVNGSMESLTAEEFKDILTAAFKRETVRVAMGLDGGMVMLGARTSQMGKREFSDLIEVIYAFAVSKGIEL